MTRLERSGQWKYRKYNPVSSTKKYYKGKKKAGGGGQRFSRETESIVQIDRHTDLEKSELL